MYPIRRERNTVGGRAMLSIFELTERKVFELRTRAQYGFRVNSDRMRLVRDPVALDWYLELTDPGPTCFNTAITIVETPCHYGGVRQWLLCPSCDKRVAILYKDRDDFKCRKCLKIEYQSQSINYRSIEPTLNYMGKLREMDYDQRRYSYKGKLTKRGVRYEKLWEKVNMGVKVFLPRLMK